ncbi:MAG: hypothetical protein LBO64_10295 [Desulfovibrio sp.]|jgi:hypothetical protein|nr:hypothetical protein [Desulfovibrio sp.]
MTIKKALRLERLLSLDATIVFLLLSAFPLSGTALADQSSGATARHIFTLLPSSIFENTPEGLTEPEKQRLLTDGRSEFWEVVAETGDSIVFMALPFSDSAVGLQLFRNQHDHVIQAAIGTLGGPFCTLELWRVDASNRIVPVDAPQEPEIKEFFSKGQRLPPDVQAEALICLGDNGLTAKPVFWKSSGLAFVPVANDIRYPWNGKAFEKTVTPRE